MVIRRALAVGLCLAAAACSRGSGSPALRLSQPSAVAVFYGYTARHAELWPYVAVANSAQDELIMFDAVNDRVVAAPIVLRPLSIPVGAPRPALLASARFPRPSAEAPPRPSLLVVATAGSSALQLVRTWHDPDAIATGPGLAEVEPVELGDEVLALVATQVPDGSGPGGLGAEADRLRVVAALAGGRMGIVDYQWTGEPETGSAAAIATTFVDLGFDAVSLAVDPRDPRFLYAASLEPIGGVFGVAQFDMLSTPAGWAARPIDAHAPTRLVAAFSLRERVTSAAGAYDQSTIPTAADAASAFETARASRVYALRDPGACGPDTPVACGIAVLDPVAGDVLEDPWRPGRSLPPITLPSRPVAMIVGPPAANPPAGDNATLPGEEDAELMLIAPGNAARLTTGVLLLPSEDGRNYFADLARWETPSSVLELSSGSGTGVTLFRPSSAALPRIGFHRPDHLGASSGAELEPNANAASYVDLTPGFTPTDQWTVTFQGYLPAFATSRTVQVESAGAGVLRVAFHFLPPGSTTPVQVVNVHDPARGVRVGDIVEFWTGPSADGDTHGCPDTSASQAEVAPIEGKILAIAPPDPGHPGGSLLVQKGDCVPWATGSSTACESERRGPWTTIEDEECWNLLPNRPRQVRLRAGSGAPGSEELVVVGAATGYAGRAVSSPTRPATLPTFSLTNEDETALVAACPLIPYPSDPLAVACDDACRTTCEHAAIARRARRLHLTSVACYENPSVPDSYCSSFFPEFMRPATGDFPPPDGPALAFSLGVTDPAPADPPRLLVRDTRVTFSTRSGRVPASRFGGGGNGGPATSPTGGAYFDRTEDPTWDRADERYRFFVPYVGNLVLDLSPARSNISIRILR